MKMPLAKRRTLALAGVGLLVIALLAYAALRTGPFAPVRVTVASVEERALSPAIYGTGTVEARYVYRIGPTVAGRLKRLDVQVGDRVRAGQVVGEMDAVDLEERMKAQDAAVRRAEAAAAAAQAQLQDASTRERHAAGQHERYAALRASGAVSLEMLEGRGRDYDAARANAMAAGANVEAAREELSRLRAEREALSRQKAHLKLVAPVAGLVVSRDADPGTTVIAGQPVVEIIDSDTVWIQVRFDQASAAGLRAGLPARIALRSRAGESLAGRVARVEPRADAVTEEILAKIRIDASGSLPPLGERTEVTVALPSLPSAPVISNAAVQRVDGRVGVWVIEEGRPRFRPIRIGAADLEGRVQVLEGLQLAERIVVHSQRALGTASRVDVVEQLVASSS